MVNNEAKYLIKESIESKNINIPTDDLSWSTVKVSELFDNEYRVEASLYNLEGKHAREVLDNSKWDLTTVCGDTGLASSYYLPRFKRTWVNKSKYPIYQPSLITEINPKPSGYISENTKTDIEALKVKKGQILLTRSGTIGNITLVNETLNGKIFSDDLIRIDTFDNVDSGFLYAFLKTKIGKTLINTNNYGAVISHIEPGHLSNVPIPNPPYILKSKIDQLIKKSFDLRDKSNQLLEKAQILFKKSLNLPHIDDFEVAEYGEDNEIHTFTTRLSELNMRLDASYHIPLVRRITNHFNEHSESMYLLGNPEISSEIILPGRFKRVYVEEGQGTVFFGGKQLYELDPSNKKYLSKKHHSERLEKELTLRENMIMITCSGTIGKVNMAPKHWEGWSANQHILRVVPKNESLAGYLFVVLSSEYGYYLITRHTYGSVVDEIDNHHISEIPIPILEDENVQNEINDLALEANKLRYEAHKLEQEAIKIMEEDVIYQNGIKSK